MFLAYELRELKDEADAALREKGSSMNDDDDDER